VASAVLAAPPERSGVVSGAGASVDSYETDERRPAAEAAAVALLHAQHAVWASGRKRTKHGGELVREPFGAKRGVCTHGNHTLHLAALHDRPDTYAQLLVAGATPFVRNGWGQSPLALAAAHGSNATFCAALGAVSETVWLCGRVSCVRTPLEEIDTLFKHVGAVDMDPAPHVCFDPANSHRMPGARTPSDGSRLLGNAGRTTVFEILIRCERGSLIRTCPQLVQLVQDKWLAFGRLALLGDALLTFGCVLLIAISLSTSAAARGLERPPDCSELVEVHVGGVIGVGERVGERGFAQRDGSFACFFFAACLMTTSGVDRLFAGTCRVLPVLQQLYHEPSRCSLPCLFRYYRRVLNAFWPVHLNVAALDGIYWTCISLTLPFHPVFSPPVARALACTIGGNALDSTASNLLIGLGAIAGGLRLLYALAIHSPHFGAHLLAAAALLPQACYYVFLVFLVWTLGFAAAMAPTFGILPNAWRGHVESAYWWHDGWSGAVRGLMLLFFGEFDFDDLLGSTMPVLSGLLYAAFVVGLVVLGVNCVLAALTMDHAERLEAAKDRQAWLRAAHIYRAESGFIGGALKYAQLQAVRCSNSVPQGYALCDVLRPAAYCRPSHARPMALDSALYVGEVLDVGRWAVEVAAGRKTQHARTWCLVMLHQEVEEDGADCVGGVHGEQQRNQMQMQLLQLLQAEGARHGVNGSRANGWALSAVPSSRIVGGHNGFSAVVGEVGFGAVSSAVATSLAKGAGGLYVVQPPTPRGLATLSPSPWAAPSAPAHSVSPSPVPALGGDLGSGRGNQPPPASASARLSSGLAPLEKTFSPNLEPAPPLESCVAAPISPNLEPAPPLESCVAAPRRTKGCKGSPSQKGLAVRNPNGAAAVPATACSAAASVRSTARPPPRKPQMPQPQMPQPQMPQPQMPQPQMPQPLMTPWQPMLVALSSTHGPARISSPRATAVAQRMQLTAPSPVILAMPQSRGDRGEKSSAGLSSSSTSWGGGATDLQNAATSSQKGYDAKTLYTV
jgi:hypothetical protein